MNPSVAHFAADTEIITRGDAKTQVFSGICCDHGISVGACATNVRRVAAEIVVGTLPAVAATAFRVVDRVAVGVHTAHCIASREDASNANIACRGCTVDTVPSAARLVSGIDAITRRDAKAQILTGIRYERGVGACCCAADVRRVAADIVIGTLPAVAATAFRVTIRITVGIGAAEHFSFHQRAADGNARCCRRPIDTAPCATSFIAGIHAVIRGDAKAQMLTGIRRDRGVRSRGCAADVCRVAAGIVVGALPAEAAAAFRVIIRIAVTVSASEYFSFRQGSADDDAACVRCLIGRKGGAYRTGSRNHPGGVGSSAQTAAATAHRAEVIAASAIRRDGKISGLLKCHALHRVRCDTAAAACIRGDIEVGSHFHRTAGTIMTAHQGAGVARLVGIAAVAAP